VSWQGFDEDGDELHYAVFLGQVGGALWFPLAVDFTGNQLNFVVPPFFAIKSAVIRVISTDSINTSVAISDPPFNLGDVVPPVLTLNGLASMTIEAFDQFIDPGVTAIDAVAGDLTAKIRVSGSVNAQVPGTYTLTYRVVDPYNNVSETSRIVTVVDTKPPVLKLPANLKIEPDSGYPIISYVATAVDQVDGSVPAACSPASGTRTEAGLIYVSCSAVDGHRNQVTGGFIVDLRDTTPPTLNVPGNIIVEATGAVGVTFLVTGQDLVTNTIVSCTRESGSIFAMGTTLVTCSATDFYFNSVRKTFSVTVKAPLPDGALCFDPVRKKVVPCEL
jgi:hypothetical protein